MVDAISILIVEDEAALADMLRMMLEQSGYHCLIARDTQKAHQSLDEYDPQLVLLDWMLPGGSGIDFLRHIRRQQRHRLLPVIMMTAKSEEDDIVKGLDSGADDYITKPFAKRELLARVESLLRRAQRGEFKQTVHEGGLRLDIANRQAYWFSQAIALRRKDYELLTFFMQHQDRVYSREQLLDLVWGDDAFIEERTVDVSIRRLRNALIDAAGNQRIGQCIKTVRGFGYRFDQDALMQVSAVTNTNQTQTSDPA